MEPPSSRSVIQAAAPHQRGRRAPLVGVVGPCGSGKSTLIAKLEPMGYFCRHIAQEHSYVPSMWQKIAKPDVLIYLAASFKVSTARRQLNWEKKDHDEQLRRLEHARSHASLVVDTDELTPDQVLQKVLDYLKEVKA